jgi:hypothetical protein
LGDDIIHLDGRRGEGFSGIGTQQLFPVLHDLQSHVVIPVFNGHLDEAVSLVDPPRDELLLPSLNLFGD